MQGFGPDFRVGIGGPVLGSVGALVCLIVGWASDSMFWYALASTGFLINLFNLIPISPLDGGRIVGVISRWIWVVGYAVGIVVFLLTFVLPRFAGVFQGKESVLPWPTKFLSAPPVITSKYA